MRSPPILILHQITGPFFDWGLEVGFLGFKVKEKTAQIWDDGSVPFSTSNLTTIGKAIVSLLSTPERLSATENKHVYIASHTVTQRDILASFEKVTGAKWDVEHIKSEEAGAKAKEQFEKGDYSAIPDLIRSAFLAPDELGNFGEKVSNDILGLQKENLEADVKRVAASV